MIEINQTGRGRCWRGGIAESVMKSLRLYLVRDEGRFNPRLFLPATVSRLLTAGFVEAKGNEYFVTET
jgi:hypothetical protein